MTKKQSYKKKVSVKLVPGQAIFVADIEVMNHIIQVYSDMSVTCQNDDESNAWMDVALQIEEWCNKTYHSGDAQEDYEEEW